LLSFSPKSFVFPSHIKKLKIKTYKTVILPVVLYGCETWSVTLREEHRLRVFENSVLRRIFGPKGEEDGSWRKLHNNELHDLYSSPNIVRVIKSRKMRWAGHVARMGEGRGVYSVLVGRPEGKRPLGRPRRRWEDNIKMDLRKIGIDGANWIHLAQDRVQWRAFVSTAMNLRVPYRKKYCLTSRVTIIFSNNILHHGVSYVLPQAHEPYPSPQTRFHIQELDMT
jgi:hypothetical protein